MTDIALRVENLSKLYRIGGPQARYKTLRESLVDIAAAPARRLRRLGQPSPENETIWALKDVSFEVEQGDVVGIIGRNGAGKTTLLRILSRITEPTEGHAEIKGRVGSLLEVGTGFHPELTGRENIYLNGAILGMKRAEIDRRFDEIVAFSEIEKFLDTPVKRYSSGMHVRLAFAVAAHLEPEILLVDEVLAVGDAAFQKKCLGKMEDVAGEGRTVLFVSHSMAAIQRLSARTLLLADGCLALDGRTQEVVEAYLSSKREMVPRLRALDSLQRKTRLGDRIRFSECLVFDSKGNHGSRVLFGEPFSVYLEARAEQELQDLSVVIGFDSFLEHRIVTVASEDSEKLFSASPCSPLRVSAQFNDLALTPGVYWLTIGIRRGRVGLDHLPHVLKLEVLEAADEHHSAHSGTWGFIYTLARWSSADQSPLG